MHKQDIKSIFYVQTWDYVNVMVMCRYNVNVLVMCRYNVNVSVTCRYNVNVWLCVYIT